VLQYYNWSYREICLIIGIANPAIEFSGPLE
jgi:hypothetical protein